AASEIVASPAPAGIQRQDSSAKVILIGAIFSRAGASATEAVTLTTDANTSAVSTAGYVPDTLSSSDELVKLALPLRITARQQRHGLAAASGSINGPNKVAAATLRGLPPPVLLSPPRIQPPASRITQPAGAATTTTLQWEVVRAADRLSLQAVPPSPSKLVSAVDITALPSASPLLPAPPRAFRRLPHRHASFADIMHRLRREDRQPPPAVLVKEGGPAAVAAAATTAAAAADKRRTFFNRGLRPNNFLDDPKSSEVSVDIPAATAAASAGAPRTKRSMSITG
ncbi:hypothetical protein Vretimale_16883, partial [Volvox reticuliferus]